MSDDLQSWLYDGDVHAVEATELPRGSRQLTLRFIVRDFTWDDDALEKQTREAAALEVEEKELWVRDLPLAPDRLKHFRAMYPLYAHA